MEISAALSVIGVMMTVRVHTTILMTAAATESIGETDGCPGNLKWTPKSQSCYLNLTNTLNFTQAIESCKELGAHLMFIGSEEENKYIQDFARNMPIWIGLYRTTNEYCAKSLCGNWVWLDGSVQQYSQWADGASRTKNQCVFIDSQGFWDHGRLCSVARAYVCEQRRIFPSTTQEGNLVSPTNVTGGNNGDENIPIVVGCVVGGVFLVGIVIAFMVLAKRHRKNKIAEPNGTSQHPHPLSYRNTSKPDHPTRQKIS